jgi:hypothetical protein
MRRTAGIYLKHKYGLYTKIRKKNVGMSVDRNKKNTYIKYKSYHVLNISQIVRVGRVSQPMGEGDRAQPDLGRRES